MSHSQENQKLSLIDILDAESRAYVYQVVQELAPHVSADSTVLVYSKDTFIDRETLPASWNLIIRVNNPKFQIEAHGQSIDFRDSLQIAKDSMIDTLIEISSQNETPSERSQRVDEIKTGQQLH